jgi:hypothetical protein
VPVSVAVVPVVPVVAEAGRSDASEAAADATEAAAEVTEPASEVTSPTAEVATLTAAEATLPTPDTAPSATEARGSGVVDAEAADASDEGVDDASGGGVDCASDVSGVDGAPDVPAVDCASDVSGVEDGVLDGDPGSAEGSDEALVAGSTAVVSVPDEPSTTRPTISKISRPARRLLPLLKDSDRRTWDRGDERAASTATKDKSR